MNVKNYEFIGTLKAIGASESFVTIDENGEKVYLTKADVIALCQHFKLTADDIKG